MALLGRAVTILTLCFCAVAASNEPSVPDLIKVIQRILLFYKYHQNEMILDGIFGLRILEGHLSLIMEEHEGGNSPKLKDDVISTVKMLHQESSNIAEQSLPKLKENNRQEYNDLGFLVNQPWKVWKPYRKLDMSKTWPKVKWDKSHVVMSEERSDSCMKELLKSKCEPSSNCLELMIGTKYMTDYGITHQVLYLQLAEEVGCLPRLEHWLIAHNQPDGVPGWQHTLCANILNSVQEKFTKANFKITKSYQDLFMEEQIVCASFGFKREFLHPQLLKEIISWQKPSGCFGNDENRDKQREPNRKGVASQPKSKKRSGKPKERVNIAKQRFEQVRRNQPSHMGEMSNQNSHKQNLARLNRLRATHSPYAVLHIAQPPKPEAKMNYSDTGAVLLNKKHLSVINDQLYEINDKRIDQHRINELKQAEAVLEKLREKQKIIPTRKISNQVYDRKEKSIRRNLLATRDLMDGCEIHATAVAAGVLGIYLHHYLENPPVNILESTPTLKPKIQPLNRSKPPSHDIPLNTGKINRNTSQVYDYDAGDKSEEDEGNDEDDSPDQANENDYIDSNVGNVRQTFNRNKSPKKIVIGPNAMKHQRVSNQDDDYDRYDYEKEDPNKDADDDSYDSKNENKDLHIDENQSQDKRDSRYLHIDNHFSSSLPYTHLLFFAIIMFGMIFVMYKFIKRRRVSVRYKSFSRA